MHTHTQLLELINKFRKIEGHKKIYLNKLYFFHKQWKIKKRNYENNCIYNSIKKNYLGVNFLREV